MKVSVLVPVYNGDKTLEETLSSILAQSHRDLEVLVVDDGSTDDSAEIIMGFKDDRIKYFKKDPSGSPAAPRNFGLAKATGDFIALCDQDDIWYSRKLEKQINEYNAYDGKDKIGIIYSQADYIDQSGMKIGHSDINISKYLDPRDFFERLIMGNFIIACSVLIPKKVADEVGSFNENLRGNDEYEFYIRISKKFGALFTPSVLCAWRFTGENFSAKKSQLYEENEKIFKVLEKDKQNSKIIQIGHGKNINRVMVAAVLEDNKEMAISYAKNTKNYPVSIKSKIISYFICHNYPISEKILKFYQRRGKISL